MKYEMGDQILLLENVNNIKKGTLCTIVSCFGLIQEYKVFDQTNRLCIHVGVSELEKDSCINNVANLSSTMKYERKDIVVVNRDFKNVKAGEELYILQADQIRKEYHVKDSSNYVITSVYSYLLEFNSCLKTLNSIAMASNIPTNLVGLTEKFATFNDTSKKLESIKNFMEKKKLTEEDVLEILRKWA